MDENERFRRVWMATTGDDPLEVKPQPVPMIPYAGPPIYTEVFPNPCTLPWEGYKVRVKLLNEEGVLDENSIIINVDWVAARVYVAEGGLIRDSWTGLGIGIVDTWQNKLVFDPDTFPGDLVTSTNWEVTYSRVTSPAAINNITAVYSVDNKFWENR